MTVFDTLWSYIRIISIVDIIDILIVAFAIYKLISYARETRVSQLLKGIVILLVVMQVSVILKLNAVSFILQNLMQFGFLAIIVVFQPELRRILETVGTKKWRPNFLSKEGINPNADIENVIDSVCKAVSKMSLQHIGALIVFERNTYLQDVAKTGTRLEAMVSVELLQNIFYPKAPMHDGAVVISREKVVAAGCILPLSQQRGINKELGTRHRAALGASETSDAIVVVVSEESGMISIAQGGVLSRNLTVDRVGERLREALFEKDETVKKHQAFWDNIINKQKKEEKTKDE